MIASDTFAENTTLIKPILTLPKQNEFTVNFAKPKWCYPSKEFVGMVIDHRGHRPNASKIAALARLTPPVTGAESRQFLGMMEYMRDFIETYYVVATRLRDIL